MSTPSLETLLQEAVTVRDETRAEANTARRVGTALVHLVEALSASLPFSELGAEVTATGVRITYRALDPSTGQWHTEGVDIALPKPQASRNGDTAHYVYALDDPESKASVLNAPDTFVRQMNGHLMMQKGLWNPEGATLYYSRNVIPGATTSADGVLTHEVFARLGEAGRIYLAAQGAESVTLSYPNWAEGGARLVVLPAATTAHAGLMTAADRTKLDALDPAGGGTGAAALMFQTVDQATTEPLHASTMWKTGDAIVWRPGTGFLLRRLTGLDAAQYYNYWTGAPEGYAAPGGAVTGQLYVCRADWKVYVTASAKTILTQPAPPEPQEEAEGDEEHYLYSLFVADGSGTRTVLTAGQTRIFQSSGQLVFRRGAWTPSGNTYWTTRVPVATSAADGAMARADKAKLDALPAADDAATLDWTRGRAETSSAYTDPQAWLGSFAGAEALADFNAALDLMAGRAGDTASAERWTGRVRATVDGRNVEVRQYVTSFAARRLVQVVEGPVSPAGEAGAQVALTADVWAILTRSLHNGAWTAWAEPYAPPLYGRRPGLTRAVNGVFALTAGATDEQIRAALTEYATKAELTRADLEAAAAAGQQLWDEQTQAFVSVTHNGGGMFNLMELSQRNYTELPRLRFVGLRCAADGTWAVTRPGQEERIAFKSELDALEARVAALEGA